MMNAIRARAEGAVSALAVSLKLAKEKNARGAVRSLSEQLEKAEAHADRIGFTFPDIARGQQVGIALVHSIASKPYPEHCRPLAQMIGARLATA